MGFTKDQLLGRLKELEIDFLPYEHPVVLTVEAQAKCVGDKGGALSKNLFLKDKKSRYYIVSALADTSVDMKILSQRLGLGKGGVRMAPEEALGEILQVPLGCVTPFALMNESASHVALLLDKGFKNQKSCFFHPLSNDMSVALSSHGLDKFLESIGRVPSYVDLEDNPTVGKDQPPDLASLVPSASPQVKDDQEPAAPSQNTARVPTDLADKKPTDSKAAKSAAITKAPTQAKSSNNVSKPRPFADAGLLVDEFLTKISALQFKDITEDAVLKNDVVIGSAIADSIRKHLGSDFKSLAMMFKSTAYAAGFQAGIHRHDTR